MTIAEARARCPELLLVPQSPISIAGPTCADFGDYRRHFRRCGQVHDELTWPCRSADRDAPEALGRRIKARLAENIGPHILCWLALR